MKDVPIRVLQILGQVNNGGVEAVIMNYYRHIDKTKVQFDFVVHKGSNSKYIDEVQRSGAKVYEITPYSQNILLFTYEIYKIIKTEGYTLVHSNMNALSGFPLFVAWLAGVKVRILHNHNTDAKEERIRTVIKRVLRPFAKLFANQYWACSKFAAEWMYGTNALNKGKVSIVNNAIDLEIFVFNQEKRNIIRRDLQLEGKFVIGHVGRFMRQKNHEFLIDIFNEIAKLRNDAVLLLIGEGPLLDSIKEKVKRLGLDERVKFLGVRSDVSDLYNSMDVFVLPSLYEGLPVVGVEVQANGLPFICSDTVTDEVSINENVERISLNKSAKQWAMKITKVSKDNRCITQERLRKNGFDIRKSSKKLEDFYMQCR